MLHSIWGTRAGVHGDWISAWPTITEVKVLETQRAIADGADEVDMVNNVGRLKVGIQHTCGMKLRRPSARRPHAAA